MRKINMNLKTIIYFILLLFILTSCGEDKSKVEQVTGPNQLTQEEIADGWELLFDGKTLDGWRGIARNDIPDGHWKIEDNSIRKIGSGEVPIMADGQPLKGGDLLTNQTFNNFELKFEWKISEGGNSGIKYNVIEEVSINRESTNAFGYEYQVLDDDNHNDNVNPTHRASSLYDMIEAKGKNTKPVGEYNTAKIVFNKNHGEHWLNGKKVVEYDIDTPEFEEIFQKSKYRNNENFTNHKIAHIVLQDHRNDCWYRNIKIKKLD